MAQLLLEAGAQCNEYTFDGDRCHYAALTGAIRALLRQYEQRPPPLAPLAASLRPLAPADGGAGPTPAQSGCRPCLLGLQRVTNQAACLCAARSRAAPCQAQALFGTTLESRVYGLGFLGVAGPTAQPANRSWCLWWRGSGWRCTARSRRRARRCCAGSCWGPGRRPRCE